VIQNLVQHYKVLGLEPGASLEEINQSYKDLVFIWHPDRVPQDNERLVKKSVEKIQQINEARDSLRTYHRQHKSVSSKSESKTKAYSNSATNNSRQAYQPKQSTTGSQYSQRSAYDDTRNRYRSYTRPHENKTKSYEQPRHWNYQDHYSSSSNGQSTKQNGNRDFRETSKPSTSSYTRPAEKAHRRPYSQDLRGADLSKSNFKEKDFSGRDLSEADLSYSDLSDTFLHKIILESVNLKGANLKCANLLQANLRNADLRDANLIGADLSGSDLSGANLNGAKVGFNNKIMVKITAVKLTGATLPDGSIHP